MIIVSAATSSDQLSREETATERNHQRVGNLEVSFPGRVAATTTFDARDRKVSVLLGAIACLAEDGSEVIYYQAGHKPTEDLDPERVTEVVLRIGADGFEAKVPAARFNEDDLHFFFNEETRTVSLLDGKI